MTYKEAYKSTKQWQRKASLISTFHYKMQLKGRWKIRDTAHYFDVSIGKVSEDIKIVLNMERVKECDTRQKALIILK